MKQMRYFLGNCNHNNQTSPHAVRIHVMDEILQMLFCTWWRLQCLLTEEGATITGGGGSQDLAQCLNSPLNCYPYVIIFFNGTGSVCQEKTIHRPKKKILSQFIFSPSSRNFPMSLFCPSPPPLLDGRTVGISPRSALI